MASCISMTFYKYYQWIESHCLKTCRIKHCQIKTCSFLRLHNHMWHTYSLPYHLIACWRIIIYYLTFHKRCIYSCHLQFYIVRIICLISCKQWLLAPLSQILRTYLYYLIYHWMIRCHKGCYKFRHKAKSRPLIICKQLHILTIFIYLLFTFIYIYKYISYHLLCK